MLGMELISVLFSTLFNCNVNEHLCSKIAGSKGIPIVNYLAVYFQFAKQATRYQLSSHWGWEEDAQKREGMENRGSGSCYVPGGCHRKAGEGAEKQAASKEAKAKLCVIIPFLWQIKQHFWKGHQSFTRSSSPAPVAAATGLHWNGVHVIDWVLTHPLLQWSTITPTILLKAGLSEGGG